MKSGAAFGLTQSRYHCANCGRAFAQEFCVRRVPLPHHGFEQASDGSGFNAPRTTYSVACFTWWGYGVLLSGMGEWCSRHPLWLWEEPAEAWRPLMPLDSGRWLVSETEKPLQSRKMARKKCWFEIPSKKMKL